MSPSGSQDSFSDVPRHTQQLLPDRRPRYRGAVKPSADPQQSCSSSTAAPIASIRTSCSSCSDDASSTATTVNSSVFANDCCCGDGDGDATSPPSTRPQRTTTTTTVLDDSDDHDDLRGGRSLTLCRRRYSSPTGGGAVLRVDEYSSAPGDHRVAVRPFRPDLRPSAEQQQSSQTGATRNVIVVQADVNPAADSIVNANSLTGSLRALYDASKETLF